MPVPRATSPHKVTFDLHNPDRAVLREGSTLLARRVLLSALAVVVSAVAGGALASAASAATVPPEQVITVEVATARSVVGIVRAWQLMADGQYEQVMGPIRAYVGRNGVGRVHEGSGRTPAGVFTLTRAFGSAPNNGTRLPYLRTGPDDWWDEDPASASYNRLVISRVSPGGHSENLYYAGAAYAHAVVINYNTNPVIKGAGSAMFLHVSYGAPTSGCVAVSARSLNAFMRWLDPAQHPVISIGVGAAARAVLIPTS